MHNCNNLITVFNNYKNLILNYYYNLITQIQMIKYLL